MDKTCQKFLMFFAHILNFFKNVSPAGNLGLAMPLDYDTIAFPKQCINY